MRASAFPIFRERSVWFWVGCALISAGVLLHLLILVLILGLIIDVPTLTGAAAALLVPTRASALLLAWAGRETRGQSLRELEAH